MKPLLFSRNGTERLGDTRLGWTQKWRRSVRLKTGQGECVRNYKRVSTRVEMYREWRDGLRGRSHPTYMGFGRTVDRFLHQTTPTSTQTSYSFSRSGPGEPRSVSRTSSSDEGTQDQDLRKRCGLVIFKDFNWRIKSPHFSLYRRRDIEIQWMNGKVPGSYSSQRTHRKVCIKHVHVRLCVSHNVGGKVYRTSRDRT